MSQGHRKSKGQTKKMYSLLARIIRYFIWICSCFVFGWMISINLQYPGQNQDWERDREKERGGGSWRRKTGRDDGRGFGCAWWLDFWPWYCRLIDIILWPNKMYILSVCPRDFLCSWDIWWDIYWMHRYQEANWVIHRSYQIMFLHFFFAKEILFRGQTSCTFFPYVPGTSIFIDRPQNVG